MATAKKTAKKTVAKKTTAKKPAKKTVTRTTTSSTRVTEQRGNPTPLGECVLGNPAVDGDEVDELAALRARIAEQEHEIEALRDASDQAVVIARHASARKARIGRAAKRAGFRSPEDWLAWCEQRDRNPEVLAEDDLARIRRANELRARALGDP